MDLLEGQSKCVKRTFAGTVLGAIMGGFASLANALQTHGGNVVSVIAKDPYAQRAVAERTVKTVAALGIWSGSFQSLKCVLDERKVNEPEKTALAISVSAFPFMAVKALRSEAPWVAILFALDLYHRPGEKS